jgi:hypothetical protein
MARSPRSLSRPLTLVNFPASPRLGGVIVGAETEGELTMELLSGLDPADQVSQLLRVIRIRSTVYCRSLMAAPRGFGVEARGHPASHVVTQGRCRLQVDGEPGQIELAAGDLALLPAGSRHGVRDEPATPARELDDILASTRRISTAACTTGAAGPAPACSAAGSPPKAARPTRSCAPFPQPW